MTQHSTLTQERWAVFGLDQQILMIANEMNRTTRFVEGDQRDGRRRGYERALRLTDLTVQGAGRRALRRELLRWRDLVASLYVNERADPSEHHGALRALLLLTPAAARQIPSLTRSSGGRATSPDPGRA